MSHEISHPENRIAALLHSERADSFAPYFVNRVMTRVGSMSPLPGNMGADSLYDALKWVFVRAAVACFVLIVAVGAMNGFEFDVLESASWVDVLLGLPADELADMLTYEIMF